MSLTQTGGTLEFSRDQKGFWTGTVERWGTRATVLTNIPAVGTAYGGDEPWAAATLRNVRFRESPQSSRGILTLTYSSVPVKSASGANPAQDAADNTPVYSMPRSGMERAIEVHPDYKIKWNHHLFVRKDEDYAANVAGYIAEWEEADWGDKPATTEAVRWVREGESAEYIDSDDYEWVREKMPTKPGVESYKVPGPAVVETRWFTVYNDAVTFAGTRQVGVIVAPATTFGYDLEWLIFDQTFQPDGDRWQVEIYYQGDVSWDTDLYEEPAE